jgi:hypothetical protein
MIKASNYTIKGKKDRMMTSNKPLPEALRIDFKQYKAKDWLYALVLA